MGDAAAVSHTARACVSSGLISLREFGHDLKGRKQDCKCLVDSASIVLIALNDCGVVVKVSE